MPVPPEETFRVDEWARRLQAVVNDGSNQFAQSAVESFAGERFIQPLADAVASGDPQAISDAAAEIINGPDLFALMDIDGAIEQAQGLIEQQDLQQQINDAIVAGIEGSGEVPTSEGAGGQTLLNAIGLGEGADPTAPITDAVTSLDIPTLISDALAVGESGESPLLALLGLGPDGTFDEAIGILTGETLPLLGEAFTLQLTDAQLSFENVLLATQDEDMALVTMATTTIKTLDTAFTLLGTNAVMSFQNVLLATEKEDLALKTMTTVTVPALKDSVIKAGDVFIAKFKDIDKQLENSITIVKKLADAVGSDFVRAAENARSETDRWISALRTAARLVGGLRGGGGEGPPAAQGLGLRHGIGFQQGTLGFRVPAGFPNDSFPINVTSGERIIVSPPGKSIEQATGLGSPTVEVNINGVNITNGMDLNMFEGRVTRAVTEGFAT